MRSALLITLLILSCIVRGEDLNGIWKGTLTQGPGGCYPQYFLELQINFSGDRLSGKAYDYYDKDHFVKMSFTGRYNPQTHRLVIIENEVLLADIPMDCEPCTKTYDLNYTKNGEQEQLSGDWKGIYSEKRLVCPPGKIRLTRATQSDFPVDIDQSDTLIALQKTLHLQARQPTLVNTITLPAPDVKIEFYDDAEIDHDTITVLINNKLLLYRQMLTDRPLTIHFNAFPNAVYELVMYADNMGDIPPNTALMMVTSGSEKYKALLSSSDQNTATIRFIYKPASFQSPANP
ncbi:MAG TPA: hypothetical protein VFE32_11360 [Puia sp.]|jgi:hypothetical protein|nr:hypothetical protein [Puia sp.]